MNEFTPSDIEQLKKQINTDLDLIVKRFNDDYAAWQQRTKCEAIFRWGYSSRKELVKTSVNFPVYESTPTEDDIKNATDILAASPDIPIEKA